jgi:hypothetical protein
VSRTDRAYLGDGVYASFDGYQVWLTAERDDQTHEIAIEPPVFANLEVYMMGLKRKYRPQKGVNRNAQET